MNNDMIGKSEMLNAPGIEKLSTIRELSIACDKMSELHKVLTEFEKFVDSYINHSEEVNQKDDSQKAMVSPYSNALSQAKLISFNIDSAISRILSLERKLEL